VRLSIFWRIVLTSLLIIVVMAGVNFYALFQLRQLSALNTTLASQHYPAIEQAKHIQAVAFNQLNSEKKYLAVRDPTFLQHFDEEVEAFHRGIENLVRQDASPEGRQFLEQARRYQQDRLALFHAELENARVRVAGV
jgi:two-component system sensor histidine kinase GlrK